MNHVHCLWCIAALSENDADCEDDDDDYDDADDVRVTDLDDVSASAAFPSCFLYLAIPSNSHAVCDVQLFC